MCLKRIFHCSIYSVNPQVTDRWNSESHFILWYVDNKTLLNHSKSVSFYHVFVQSAVGFCASVDLEPTAWSPAPLDHLLCFPQRRLGTHSHTHLWPSFHLAAQRGSAESCPAGRRKHKWAHPGLLPSGSLDAPAATDKTWVINTECHKQRANRAFCPAEMLDSFPLQTPHTSSRNHHYLSSKLWVEASRIAVWVNNSGQERSRWLRRTTFYRAVVATKV